MDTSIHNSLEKWAPCGIITLSTDFGTSGMLEIAIKNANARTALNARRGQPVTVRPQPAP
jgi:hypothetical protein